MASWDQDGARLHPDIPYLLVCLVPAAPAGTGRCAREDRGSGAGADAASPSLVLLSYLFTVRPLQPRCWGHRDAHRPCFPPVQPWGLGLRPRSCRDVSPSRLPARDLRPVPPGDTAGDTRAGGSGVQGRFWKPPLPAAGNKGAAWRPCHEPTLGPVSLLCRGKGHPGPRGGWRRWRQPRVSLGAPGDSGSRRGRWPPVLLGLGAGASPSCPQPRVTRGGPGPSGAASPARSRHPFPATGATGAMPRGQRGRSPAAVPRPLSRAPDVTAEPGQCHRATSSPCGGAWDDITGHGDLIAHSRVPGDATGVPCTAAERHRSTGAPGRMTQRHDVTHCGR